MFFVKRSTTIYIAMPVSQGPPHTNTHRQALWGVSLALVDLIGGVALRVLLQERLRPRLQLRPRE